MKKLEKKENPFTMEPVVESPGPSSTPTISSSSSSSSSLSYAEARRLWSKTGLLLSAAGQKAFEEQWQRNYDLSPLLSSPLTAFASLPVFERLVRHVLIALRTRHLQQFLEDRGARRDYLVLASERLLARHVSLEEAGFLLLLLKRAFDSGSMDVLDRVGDIVAAHLRSVCLVKSVSSTREFAQFAEALCRHGDVVETGLRVITVLCERGEDFARQRMVSLIQKLGHTGAVASLYVSAWTGLGPTTASVVAELEELGNEDSRDGRDADSHRHVSFNRSGSNFIKGELLQYEEDDRVEFKGIQTSANPPDAIVRYASKYVPAFLNSEGGTLLFGVTDDGRVAGIPLKRAQRDTVRLGIDNLAVVPDPSHLVKLRFLPVLGGGSGDSELYVVELEIRPGDPHVIYCMKYGDCFVRRKGGIVQLRGPALVDFLQRKIRARYADEGRANRTFDDNDGDDDPDNEQGITRVTFDDDEEAEQDETGDN